MSEVNFLKLIKAPLWNVMQRLNKGPDSTGGLVNQKRPRKS